ncbi:hypothetical protein Tco_0065064 [Tanacetum coccineum]
MLEKVKSPLCVEHNYKFAPLDYSKKNYLATFTPHRDLTPEQIFWSKEEKERKGTKTSVSRPLSALTVYPPNTPTKLVPRVLPTKSQVKINLYTLTQLFTEFDKTCKTRITPTGLTDGERGFEQTKRCYLIEVIPFFKTLKEHFKGVQTALFKEVKEMKEIFDQMTAEVDQNAVDKQCAEMERKNLLIENENLIANFLSNKLFYAVEQSCCLDLEDEISNLKHETQKDDSPEFDSFFKINTLKEELQEKDNVIRNLKIQVSKMNVGRSDTDSTQDVSALESQNVEITDHVNDLLEQNERFRAKNEKGQAELQGIAQLISKVSCVTSDSVKPKVFAPGMYAIDVEPIPPNLKNNRNLHLDYIKHLKESVETIREIVEEARVAKPLDNTLDSTCRYTKLSHELLENVIGTFPKEFNEIDNKAAAFIHLTRKNQVNFKDRCRMPTNNTQKHVVHQKFHQSNVPMIPSTGVSSSTEASGSKLRRNTKKNRIQPVKSKLSANGLNKAKQVWKATSKLFANVGYQWRPTGKKFTLGKLNGGYQWRPTGKKSPLGE